MANVFITGIAGFLGSHLADAMVADGHKVWGNDTLIGGYLDNIPKGKGVTWHPDDCNDFKAMKSLMRGVDVVYHCAATAYEGLSVFSPHLISQNIFSASAAVFSAAIANKVTRVVHCSSMARYGHGKPPFRETDTPVPVDPYGIAKLAAERLLQNLAGTHGLEYVIAVPHNIYGPRQKYDDPFRNVASIMTNLALQRKPIIIYGDGEQQRCFSYIDDCLQCLTKLAFQDNVVGRIINIGPDEGVVTINELAALIHDLTDTSRCYTTYMPGRPQEVKYAHCSSDLARDLLGYRTTVQLGTGLSTHIDWIRARGTRPFSYHLPLEFVTEKTPKTWTDRLF